MKNSHAISFDVVTKLQPHEFIFSGFCFLCTLGVNMHTGAEIEQFRQEYGFTVLCIRQSLDMTEAEYYRFIKGKYTPAAYQLIWFLIAFRCPLDSIIGKKFVEGPAPYRPAKRL